MRFIFESNDSVALEDGRRLIGSENGLGSIISADGKSFGAGYMVDGVLNGYAFALFETVKEYEYTRRPTYEEVMSTAEFDSCGRVIYCDGSMITERRKEIRWLSAGTGLWEDGRLVKPAKIVFPEGLKLKITRNEYTYGKHNYTYYPHEHPLSAANSEGFMSVAQVYVQLLPDGSVMILEQHGHVFILRPGESITLELDKNETCYYTYTYELSPLGE